MIDIRAAVENLQQYVLVNRANEALEAQVAELLEETTEARALVGQQASRIDELTRQLGATARQLAYNQLAQQNNARVIELLQNCIVKLGTKLESAKKRADQAEHQVVMLRAQQIRDARRADFAERRLALMGVDLRQAERRVTVAEGHVVELTEELAQTRRGCAYEGLVARSKS